MTKVCSKDGCDRPHSCRGLCATHYAYARRHNSLPPKEKPKPCKWPECLNTKIKARGMCEKHYSRAKNLGFPPNPWEVWEESHHENDIERFDVDTCLWEGCESNAFSRGYCKNHYMKARRTDLLDKKMGSKVSCLWPDCPASVISVGFCVKHRYRWEVLGCPEKPWEVWRDTHPLRYLNPPETGFKYCNKCLRMLPVENFHVSAVSCKECKAVISKDYRKSNPEVSRKSWEKRRAVLLEAYEEDVDVVSMADFQNWKCPYCGIEMDTQRAEGYNPKYRTLDHMIPLSRGGKHASYNVIACCYSCNIKKRDMDLGDWLNHITGNPDYSPYHGIIEEKLNLLKENTCFGQT